MEHSNLPRGQLMREYKARLARVVAGLSEREVQEVLGEPTAITRREETNTPSDFFREIGSVLRFPDDTTDAIWAYVDPYRPRVTNFIGFRNGRVQATWRDTLTQARWQELKKGRERA